MTATEDRMQAAFDASPQIMRVQLAASVADQMVAEATAEQAAHLDVMSTYVETGKKIAAAREKQLATLGKQHAEMLAALKAQHDAIDILLAMLIEKDHSFLPTKSRIWPMLLQGKSAIDRAEVKPRTRSESEELAAFEAYEDPS